MKTRHLFIWLMIITVLFAGSSCSTVFTAGLSGVVVSADSDDQEPIANVRVYAYTSQSQRDQDYDSWTAGSDFAPSVDAYVPSTTTGTDGSFTISKLVWESAFSKFGRSADVQNAYLLFYHREYGLTKNDSMITIVSDSNNSSCVRQKLSSIVGKTNLTISIRNCATEALLDQNANVKVQVYKDSTQASPQWTWEGSINSRYTVTIPYDRYSEDYVVRVYASLNGQPWSLVDCDNGYRKTPFYSYSKALGATDGKDVATLLGGTEYQINLYVKPYSFNLPLFSGTVFTSALSSVPGDEFITVWLCHKQGGSLVAYDYPGCTATTGRSGDGANGAQIIYGQFTGLGNNGIVWDAVLDDGDYEGKNTSTKVLIVADSNKNGAIDDTDYATCVDVKSYNTTAMTSLIVDLGKTVGDLSALL